jgi:hypothetical protein
MHQECSQEQRMKATCAVCGRNYEVSAETPRGNCVSCGGQLKPAPASDTSSPTATTPPGPTTPPAPQPEQAELELAGESLATPITCPNCGKVIEAGAQICTACGYSRRLARTLTTRVGTPEILKPKAKAQSEMPEIEAEEIYRRAKARANIGSGDTIRLLLSTIALLSLAAMIMLAPTGLLTQFAPLQLPPLLLPPRFDALNATLMMLTFLFVAVPITAIGVRIAAAITNTEINTYFSWLRTAGVLAATLLTMELTFTLNQLFLHLPTFLTLLTIAAVAGLALLLFTWYLHDVTFSNAIVLAIATLISAAVGFFAAAAAFGWLGNLIKIDPVIKPLNQWSWPKLEV